MILFQNLNKGKLKYQNRVTAEHFSYPYTNECFHIYRNLRVSNN